MYTSERRLCAAVMLNALHSLQSRNKAIAQDAHDWIFSDACIAAGNSFLGLCEILDLHAEDLRKKVIAGEIFPEMLKLNECILRKPPRLLTAFNETKTISAWMEDYRCAVRSRNTITSRIDVLKWPVEKALTTNKAATVGRPKGSKNKPKSKTKGARTLDNVCDDLEKDRRILVQDIHREF